MYTVVSRSLLALLPVLLSAGLTLAAAQGAETRPPALPGFNQAAEPTGNKIVNQARATYLRNGDEREDLSPEVVTTFRPVLIDLQKTAAPSRVNVGDTLTYELQVTNDPESVFIGKLQLVDTLPAALRYVPGSARVLRPDGATVAAETEVDGSTLRWTLVDLAPNDVVTVTFQAVVLPTALFATDLVNRAEALAEDGAGLVLAGAADTATTPVELGLFEQRAALLGTAFVDRDANGLYDSDDVPVPNLRLYLSDGSETVTDELGRYTFQNVEPSLAALRVDTSTAPARLFGVGVGEDKAGLWRVRLLPGVVTRRDIPFKPPRTELSVRQRLNVAMGPLAVEKSLEPMPGGFLVTLQVGSSAPLRGVVVRETLVAGATLLEAPVFADGTPPAGAGLELSLGDVPAGYARTLSYRVAFAGAPAKLLTAPTLSWDVRR